MNGAFAGGMADGLRNGMAIMNMYEGYKEKRGRREEAERQRQIDEQIAKAMGMGMKTTVPIEDLSVQEPSPQAAVAPPATQAPQPPQMQPVPAVNPGTQALDATMAAQARTAAAPTSLPSIGAVPQNSLQAALQQDQAAAQKKSPPGAEIEQLADSMMRGYRKALELNDIGRAMQLLAQGEQAMGQYRQQAYQNAAAQFELTGDPNTMVPFINRFVPGSLEVRDIQARPEVAGGEPVFMVNAFDPHTGKAVSEPFTRRRIQEYVHQLGNPQVHQAMFVEQMKALHDLDIDLRKRRNAADVDVEKAKRLSSIRQRSGLGTSRERPPAEVQTAQWLIDNGVAENPKVAWDLVRGARTKSRQEFAADIARTLLSNQSPYDIDNRLTPQQAFAQGVQLYDAMTRTGKEGDSPRAQPAAPAVGTVEDGWRFKGGDPADQANWEKVSLEVKPPIESDEPTVSAQPKGHLLPYPYPAYGIKG